MQSDKEHQGSLGNLPYILNGLIVFLGIIALGGKLSENRWQRIIALAGNEFIPHCLTSGDRSHAAVALLRSLFILDLEKKYGLPSDSLAKEIAAFTRQRADNATLSKLERAAAAFAIPDYVQAERFALDAYRDEVNAVPRNRDALIESVELTVWSYVFQDSDPENSQRSFRHFDDASKLIDKSADPLGWARILDAVAHGRPHYYSQNGRTPFGPEELERQIIAIRRAVLGPEHPDTLQSRYRLAECHRASARFEKSEEEHRAVLAIRQRVLGSEHPDTLASHIGVGKSTHVRLDSHSTITHTEEMRVGVERERQYRAALPQFLSLLGADHPETLKIRRDLADALGTQQKYAETLVEDHARIPIEEHVLGREHPDTLRSRSNLAMRLHMLGKHAEAEAEARAVLALRLQRELRAHDPALASSYIELAIYLRAQKRFDEALKYLKPAEVIYDKTYWPDHRDHNQARLLRHEIETQMKREAGRK